MNVALLDTDKRIFCVAFRNSSDITISICLDWSIGTIITFNTGIVSNLYCLFV